MLRRAAACALEATAAVVSSASRTASGAACSTSGIGSGGGVDRIFGSDGGSRGIASLLLRGLWGSTSSASSVRHASSSALRPKPSSPQQANALAFYSRIMQGSEASLVEANSPAAVFPWRLPLLPARTTRPLPTPATTTRPPSPEQQQQQQQGGSPNLVPLRADSVRRKRKHKMNKHKHRKRRKLLRHKSK